MNKQNSSLMTADGEVDLVKLVKELWVNKVLILLTTLLALIGSFTYAYLSKPVYEYRVAVNVINLSCSPAQGKPPEAASRHGRRAMTRPLPLNQAV
ncbi:Wzz/FepE/Etk N-terminal domain-containing protein [Pseudomonas aeruginosa]|uniref:Wzz/FepE/Etk N-terminal domain-containing protein n=1 Tax=Pseudomonas aeruginosa TaxID=287 RepID=UPI00235F90F9|nr:Wzz/FepE/Etk N-terminal domain-containing protein [Pseudomonas aeruginosa]WDC66096.1 Wzz/FepE/Etk N-terminal domain-containing protein [Pseudomonas aeruginosa]